MLTQALIVGNLVVGILALWGRHWAYAMFVASGLLYFPVKAGFSLQPKACDVLVSVPLAIGSLANYAHVVLFALFFLVTSAQFAQKRASTFLWSGAATMVAGALVEAAQGLTGQGHCRVRDLLPDLEGALVGAGLLYLGHRLSAMFRRPSKA